MLREHRLTALHVGCRLQVEALTVSLSTLDVDYRKNREAAEAKTAAALAEVAAKQAEARGTR